MTPAQRLARRRAQARGVLMFERLWPALWPALGALGLCLCVALLDLPRMLPAWAHLLLLAVAAVVVFGLLGRALLRLSAPTPAEADRRLETATGLAHRPLAVLADRPALPGSEQLWQAHVARAAAQIARLRVGAPRPGLPARDPRALRGLVLVALAACLVIAGADTPIRLWRAVTPGFVPPAAPPAAQLQAWITPPAYTGQAPLFLKPDATAVTVPAGSHLTVNLTGGSEPPALTLDGHATPFQALDATSFQADQDLATSGRLVVTRPGHELGAWEVTVVADRAPEVSFPTPPGGTRGRTPQVRLPWQASHAYGVTALHAELRLRDRPEAPPVVLAIPLPGGAPKTAHGVRQQDLTANPWAGLPVIARLLAQDAPGLVGTSADAEFVLPERAFQNPIAQALMAIRKRLSIKPDERMPAITGIDQLAALDDAWTNDLSGYLNLTAIGALLYRDQSDAAVAEAQARMWELALHLEEGAPERTARALEQARQELRQALEAEKRGEPTDKAELDKRMRAVEEALQKHMEALAEQAKRDPSSQEVDPEAQRLDAQDIQRKAEQMREAAQQGKMDEARQDMEQLEKMLDALQNARPEHGKMTEQQRQRAEKRQRGQQQMTALQDIVRRQGSLLDHAQERADAARAARDPRRLPLNRRFDPPADPAAPDPKVAEARGTEQRVQQALRRALGELMQQYGDLTGKIPPNLGEADGAMRDAGQALAQNSDVPAAAAELKAIEALQKGGRSMSQQMAQQFGRGQQGEGDQGEGEEGEGEDGQGQMAGDQPGDGPGQGGDPRGGTRNGPGRGDRPWNGSRSVDRRADDRRDPLGRPLHEGTSGTDESGDVQVPEQMEEARTRAIQDELRRRGAERTRPQPELDYIDRLLKQF